MLRLPLNVQLEITDRCNLRCGHCYHFDTDEMPASADLDDSETIGLAQKLIDAEVYSLIITGGEPLVRPAVVLEIARRAKKVGMFVSINTNLLCLTHQMADVLRQLEVDSLLISCPASETTLYRQITRCGDYETFKSKLTMVMESQIPCLLNMVVTRANLGSIRSTAADLAGMGVKRFCATPASLNVEHPSYEGLLDKLQIVTVLDDLDWCAQNLGLDVDILEPLPKCFFPAWCWEKEYAFTRRSCMAGRITMSISNTGDARPCSHNPLVYGNLGHRTLEELWGNMIEYREGMIPSECKMCPSVNFCKGSCRTNAMAATGSITAPDPLFVGHVTLPKRPKKEIVINDGSQVTLKGKLRWRRELDGFSVTTKSNHSNLINVNEEMLRFIRWLETAGIVTVQDIIRNGGEGTSEAAVKRVLEFLARKELIQIQ